MTPWQRYDEDPVFHALTYLLWREGFTADICPYRATRLETVLARQGIRITYQPTEKGSTSCPTQT